MRVEAGAIATKSITDKATHAEFASAMLSSCDFALVLGGEAAGGQFASVDRIDARNGIDAIKKQGAKRIAILSSDCKSPPKLTFRNAEEGIISAPRDAVLVARDAIARLALECGITELVIMLRAKEDGVFCVAAAAAGIPVTIFLPFLPTKTFAWERMKDLAWLIPRTIVKRCASIPEKVLKEDACVAVSAPLVQTSQSAPNAAAAAPSIPIGAPPVAMGITPPPSSASKHVAAAHPRPTPSAPLAPVIVGRNLAIDRGHPLHDAWALPVIIAGKTYRSVLNYMAEAKAIFFSEAVDGLDSASAERCVRYLLPDDRHDFDARRAWGRARLAAFERATEAKVEQSKQARDALLATGDRILVYMSRDRKLGIGYDDFFKGEEIVGDKLSWKGGNGAGIVLERLREVMGGAPVSQVPGGHATGVREGAQASPAVSILRKLGPVVAHRAPTKAQLDDDEDFTAEDLARLSGKIPVRISRF